LISADKAKNRKKEKSGIWMNQRRFKTETDLTEINDLNRLNSIVCRQKQPYVSFVDPDCKNTIIFGTASFSNQ